MRDGFSFGFTKIYQTIYIHVPLWLFSIALENGPLTDDFPVPCSIYNGFSIAISNNQRAKGYIRIIVEVPATFSDFSLTTISRAWKYPLVV